VFLGIFTNSIKKMPYKITCGTQTFHTFEESEAADIERLCKQRGLEVTKEEIKEMPPAEKFEDAELLEDVSRANKICMGFGFDSSEAKAVCISGILVKRAIEETGL